MMMSAADGQVGIEVRAGKGRACWGGADQNEWIDGELEVEI